jgi:hypothetical protein
MLILTPPQVSTKSGHAQDIGGVAIVTLRHLGG